MKTRVLFLASLFLIAPLALLPNASAQTNESEDFEQQTNFEAPVSDFYTFTTSGSGGFFTQSSVALDTKAFIMDPATTSATRSIFTNDGDEWNLCNSGSKFRFAFRVSAFVSGTQEFWMGGAGNFPAVGFTVGATGIISSVISGRNAAGTGVTNSLANGLTISVGTWYNVTMQDLRCSDASEANPDGIAYTLVFENENNVLVHTTEGAATEVYWCPTGPTGNCPSDLEVAAEYNVATVGTSTSNVYLDNLEWQGVIDSVDAAATATITGTFQGWDVDDNGDTVIVRSNGGEIRTYSGLTLGTAAASDTSDVCNQVDGVMSIGTLVAYISCDTGDPEEFTIKTSSLNEPSDSDFSDCSESGIVCGSFSLDGFSEEGGDCLQQIGRVDPFPIDFSVGNDFGVNRRKVAFSWSAFSSAGSCSTSNPGTVGINTYNNINNQEDIRHSEQVIFSVTQAEEICTGVDDGQFYLAAASDDANTKIYPISFTGTGANQNLEAEFGSPATYPAGVAAIDCGGALVVVQDFNAIKVLNRGTASTEASLNIAVAGGESTRSVSISPVEVDGERYVASAQEDGFARIYYASNLTEICQLTMPSGTFKEIELVTNGPSVFIVTSTTIARYELGGDCGSIPQAGTGGGEDVPVSTDGLFGGAGAQIGEVAGIGTFGGNLFLGIMTVLGCAAALFVFTKGRVSGLICGVALGVLLAWAFSFFTGGAVFVMVLMCGGGLWVFRGA